MAGEHDDAGRRFVERMRAINPAQDFGIVDRNKASSLVRRMSKPRAGYLLTHRSVFADWLWPPIPPRRPASMWGRDSRRNCRLQAGAVSRADTVRRRTNSRRCDCANSRTVVRNAHRLCGACRPRRWSSSWSQMSEPCQHILRRRSARAGGELARDCSAGFASGWRGAT